MFEESDFEMPLEKQLRIRVIEKEIDECTDVDALRQNLKQCAVSLMKYQHLLSVTLRKQIEKDMDLFGDKIIKEVSSILLDGNSGQEQN